MKQVLLVFFLSLQITLSAQPDLFGPQIEITFTSEYASSVFAADLDGDGDQDVLSASGIDDKIAWYGNEGNGNFGEQNIISTQANGASSVYATDLDGDGDQDVLSASVGDDKIAWYENDGYGVFGGQISISTQADFALSVYATDLDGDGDQDVLSASENDDKIAWYKNNGLGFFGLQKIISTQANGARSIFATDFDGDGDQDVLSASTNDSKIAWYENVGSGNFGGQNIISTQADGVWSVYANDLDGDGDQDVLSASLVDDKIAWYVNEGNGNFGGQSIITAEADGAYSVFASDLDGDGDQDVLSASENDDKIAWYENEGNGNFGVQIIISTQVDYGRLVYASDLDGDGDHDVLSASLFDNKVTLYSNLHSSKADFINTKSCLCKDCNYSIVNTSNFILDPATTYQWIFNNEVIATTRDLENINLPPGNIDLSLVTCTTTNCDTITKQIDVLEFVMDSEIILAVNTPYTFTNVSNNIGYWVWEFGDGGLEEVQTPSHTYTEPGVYELEVNVYNTDIAEDCFHQLEYKVIVLDSVFYNSLMANEYFINPNPADNELILKRANPSANDQFVIYNYSGQSVLEQMLGDNYEEIIPLGNMASGFYYCRLSNSERVHKLVIAH